MADWDWSIPGVTDSVGAGSTPPSALTVPDIVQKGVANLQSGIKGILGSLSASEGQASKVTTDITNAAKAEAGAKDQIATIDAIAQQKTIKDNASTAAMLGTQAGAASDLIAQYFQAMKPKMQEMYDVHAKLEGMERVSPFDDPISYILNSFTKPFLEKRADRLEHDLGVEKAAVSNVQAVSEAAMRDNAIDDTADATTKLAANAVLNKAQSDITAANALHEQIAQNLQGLNIRQTGTMEEFDSVIKAQSAAVSQLAVTQQGIELKQKEALQGIETQKAQLMMKVASENQEDKDAAEAAVNKGSILMGQGPTTLAQFKMFDDVKKQAILSAAASPVGAPGITAARTLDLYTKGGMLPESPAMVRTMEKMQQWVNPVLASHEATWKGLAPEEQVRLKDEAIKNESIRELKNIPTGDSMYSFQPLAKVLGTGPIIDLPLAKEMAPLATDPMHATKADDFIAISKSLIIGNKMTVADAAAQMSKIFQGAATDNNKIRNYTAFNLRPLDVNNLPVTVANPLGRGTTLLNMGDEAAVRNYLTKSIIKEKGRRLGEDQGSGLPAQMRTENR